MEIINGQLTQAAQCPSPNVNQRPNKADICLLVIHNISLPPGEFGTGCVQQFFQNQLNVEEHPYFQEIEGLQVSSHLLIERNGEVTQFVNFDDRAWHAGVSSFEGREACNDFSIGIELEGTDDTPYADEQYQSLLAVAKAIMKAYPRITLDRVVGHCDIAPGRKTDPGAAFDWQWFRQQLGLQSDK